MRTLRIALLVSVVLNLFLAGALAGGAAWLHSGRPFIAAGSLRIAGAELSRDQRRGFRAALREARRKMRPEVIESRAEKLKVAALLRQPVVDQPSIVAALDRARVADTAVRAAVETRAVAYAAQLPPADRAKLADAMESRATHRP